MVSPPWKLSKELFEFWSREHFWSEWDQTWKPIAGTKDATVIDIKPFLNRRRSR